jgi:formylglycine-generating enzyme required for sulfatase activity
MVAGGCRTEEPKTVTNSVGMQFVLIPAGEFTMGSSESPEELAK